jgi:hypothetical protein
MQHKMVVYYQYFRTTYWSQLQGSSRLGLIDLADGTNMLFRNVSKILKEHRSHLHHRRNLKSCIHYFFENFYVTSVNPSLPITNKLNLRKLKVSVNISCFTYKLT